jgi:hypothetical protein
MSTMRSNLALAVLVLASVACSPGGNSADASNGAVYDAWRAQRSRVEVTASGTIARVLGTRSGRYAPHDGFLLHLRGPEGRGLTIRVEDNVTMTGQIALVAGADAIVRGEYVYDPRGGIVHWTHRDPRGHHAAGYVQTGGKLYQ